MLLHINADVRGLIYNIRVRLEAKCILHRVRAAFYKWATGLSGKRSDNNHHILTDQLQSIRPSDMYIILYAAIDGLIVPGKYGDHDCTRTFEVLVDGYPWPRIIKTMKASFGIVTCALYINTSNRPYTISIH